MTALYKSDDINISILKIDIIEFLTKLILSIFANHVMEQRINELECPIDEWLQDIGLDMSSKH